MEMVFGTAQVYSTNQFLIRAGNLERGPSMSTAVATTAPLNLPKNVQSFLDNPPLVGNEVPEEYEAVFMAIVNVLKPSDFFSWQSAQRLADLAWYIRRERMLKNEIIRLHHKEIVSELLGGPFNNRMVISEDAHRWERDPNARLEIDQQLVELGHCPDSVLAQAYIRGAEVIDKSDRRAATYETESIAVLKNANLYSERLARQIDRVSDVVDAEFSEAAE
jgi:hypothetical protein